MLHKLDDCDLDDSDRNYKLIVNLYDLLTSPHLQSSIYKFFVLIGENK